MFRNGRVVVASVAVVCSLGVAAAIAAPVGAVPPAKNASLFFHRSDAAPAGYRATLAGANLVQKGAAAVAAGLTLVAISRDTMLMYNPKTGAGVTGTYFNGVFTKKHTYTLTKGFAAIAASCDTAFFFNTADGKLTTGILNAGALTPTPAWSGFAPGGWLITASCNTVLAYQTSTGYMCDSEVSRGAFVGGDFDWSCHNLSTGWTSVAATEDSVLFYDKATGIGAWGTLQNGVFKQTGAAHNFSTGFTNVAGTANSLFFYRSGSASIAATSTLVHGVYTFGHAVPNLSHDWSTIAGGK
jgi:hypothetical protein